ncbi:MAG: hypothetical protein KDA78_01755 [Planctomycetaceae bacterium]|nr:hypothetical protein [Planctomycetaceae bacterium]
MNRTLFSVSMITCILFLAVNSSHCFSEEVLFADSFDQGLSERWELVGLSPEDYRIREGGLEIRIRKPTAEHAIPMLKVKLPFSTRQSVIATVEVTVDGQPLQQGDSAGVCLTYQDRCLFSARKENHHGYWILSPGQVEFIGRPGEEGNPGKYTVRYWPADEEFGPLRIVVRQEYAYFQVGPSKKKEFKTFFHSAITSHSADLGFGLFATGNNDKVERWVRFDHFEVTR